MSQASGRRRATLEFFLMSAPIFDLLVKCTALIMSQDVPGHNHTARHILLLEKLSKSGRRFFDWSRDWIADVSQPDSLALSSVTQKRKVDIDTWLEYVLDFQTLVTLIYNRLYVALGGEDAARVERQSQQIAHKVSTTYKSRYGSLGFQESVALNLAVQSIQSTAGDWSRMIEDCSAVGPRLVPSGMYACWIKRMGITIDTNNNQVQSDITR